MVSEEKGALSIGTLSAVIQCVCIVTLGDDVLHKCFEIIGRLRELAVAYESIVCGDVEKVIEYNRTLSSLPASGMSHSPFCSSNFPFLPPLRSVNAAL